jgi:predicted unusual protein kinase regulating ubiquinone biosynthesis (AarF/ABC1/UbiB family)
MKSERKWYRMWKVLSFVFSMLIQVYWYKFTKKSAKDWDLLWGKLGKQLRTTLFELEGLLIKVGQMLSIRADLLPHNFVKELEDLVDQVPPSDWERIKQVLEKEWSAPVELQLLSIEPKAIASASIGEVYRGILKDGSPVAIKVQRPAIERIVETDFRTLSIIIWFAHYLAPVPKGFISFKKLYQELKQVIERELDFKKEMETAIYFKKRFKSFNGVRIPTVYPELCTSKVMVMEWVEGERVTDIESLTRLQIDRDHLSKMLFRLFLPQWLEPGMFHADPHSGNVLVQSDGTIILLDFGMVSEISKSDATHFQSLLESILLKNYQKASEVLLQLGFLLPDADLKVIEKLLAELLTFDITNLKEMDLFAIKKEMNELVRNLPVQVPTRFVFLGRSFVTIEGMLHTISPNEEILEIIKPAFMDWLNQSERNKWKLFWKWINSQPVFQIFHTVTDLLQKPQQYLDLKKIQQKHEFQFKRFENRKNHSFYLGLGSLIGVYLGIYLREPFIWQSSAGIFGLSTFSYFVSDWQQKKWLRTFK